MTSRCPGLYWGVRGDVHRLTWPLCRNKVTREEREYFEKDKIIGHFQ